MKNSGFFCHSEFFREINIGDPRSVKSAILTHLEALNFDFYEFGHFLSAESYQNRNFRSSKIAKKADFECLYSSKLISRKI